MRRKLPNQPIRQAAERNGMYLYEVASLLGVSESTLQKKMRVEMTEEQQQKIINVIEDEGAKMSAK